MENLIQIKNIDSIDDPVISKFSGMKDKLLKQQGQIIVDSPKVVLRMLGEGILPSALLATHDFISEHQDLLASHTGIDIYASSRLVMECIVGHRLHHGVIALASRPENCKLSDLGQRILILDGVNKAENIGAMMRSCDSFGVDSVLVDESSLSPYSRRCIRVSMGSIFRLKVRHSQNLSRDMRELQANGVTVIGTGNYQGAHDLHGFRFPKKSALVIGSEGFGMGEELRGLVDLMVKIPIREVVDSLNASIAASICLYEMAKP